MLWRMSISAIALMLVLVVGVAISAVTARHGAASAGHFLPVAVVAPTLQPGVVVTETIPSQITFDEMAPPAAFADGQPVISPEQALQVATANFPTANQPNSQATVLYGVYLDRSLAKIGSDGQRQPLIQGRPAWLVRETGLDLPPVGGLYYRLHPDQVAKDANHEENLFVDAETGRFLGGITFR